MEVSPLTLQKLVSLAHGGRGQSGKYEKNDSEAIEDIQYDVENSDLTVIFKARGTYVYHEFPLDDYTDFLGASSWGTYFNLYIRNRGFSYERVG